MNGHGADAHSDGKPAVLSGLVLLSELVDLSAADGEARALWYIERIQSGAIQAYGRAQRRRGPGQTDLELLREIERDLWAGAVVPPVAIPAAEWRGHIIQWSDGIALAKIQEHPNVVPAWYDITIAGDDGLDGLGVAFAEAAAREREGSLGLTFHDAGLVVRRWRERQPLPVNWPFPAEDYWRSHPGLRPMQGEIDGAIRKAIRQDELHAAFEAPSGEWEYLPAVAWNATEDRVWLDLGRVNLAGTWPARASWAIALLTLHELRSWMAAAWPSVNPIKSADAVRCGAQNSLGGTPARKRPGPKGKYPPEIKSRTREWYYAQPDEPAWDLTVSEIRAMLDIRGRVIRHAAIWQRPAGWLRHGRCGDRLCRRTAAAQFRSQLRVHAAQHTRGTAGFG